MARFQHGDKCKGCERGGTGEQGPDHPWKPCKGSLVKTSWEAVSQARDDGGLAWRNEGGARWTDLREVRRLTQQAQVWGGSRGDKPLAWTTRGEESLDAVPRQGTMEQQQVCGGGRRGVPWNDGAQLKHNQSKMPNTQSGNTLPQRCEAYERDHSSSGSNLGT